MRSIRKCYRFARHLRNCSKAYSRVVLLFALMIYKSADDKHVVAWTNVMSAYLRLLYR